MKTPLTALARLLAIGCLFAANCPASDENPVAARGRDLPPDARNVTDRLASCTHFAGEFNGDNSDRDKEVAATLSSLHCNTLEQDVAAIRKKYAGDEAVLEALRQASEP